jgi:hypothetical protein
MGGVGVTKGDMTNSQGGREAIAQEMKWGTMRGGRAMRDGGAAYWVTFYYPLADVCFS